MGTNLTVNSYGIADVQVQTAQLASLLGSYTLNFIINGTVHPRVDSTQRCLVVYGAQIFLRTKGGLVNDLGFATSDLPAVLRQGQYPSPMQLQLKVALQPHQLEALEAYRDGGDLDFELRLSARGEDHREGRVEWPEQATLSLHVAESAWIVQLNSAKAVRMLLLEIPMPYLNGTSTKHPAEGHLLDAQEHFVTGNYRECVADCRQFTEALGGVDLASKLNPLKGDRTLMDKDQRISAMLATLQHYTHLAAHAGNKGGVDYSRLEAKLALSLAASFAAFHFGKK